MDDIKFIFEIPADDYIRVGILYTQALSIDLVTIETSSDWGIPSAAISMTSLLMR